MSLRAVDKGFVQRASLEVTAENAMCHLFRSAGPGLTHGALAVQAGLPVHGAALVCAGWARHGDRVQR